jgi:hypothetical protein
MLDLARCQGLFISLVMFLFREHSYHTIAALESQGFLALKPGNCEKFSLLVTYIYVYASSIFVLQP